MEDYFESVLKEAGILSRDKRKAGQKIDDAKDK